MQNTCLNNRQQEVVMKNLRKYIYAFVVLILIAVSYAINFNSILGEFRNTCILKQTDLNNAIMPSVNIIKALTIYGNNYFDISGSDDNSELYSLIRYDSASNSYNLDAAGGTEYEKKTGSLTGLGNIPESGIVRQELDMALNMNDFFSAFYNKYPEITWLYYTSDHDFILEYPWTPSSVFSYSEKLKTVAFYTAAIPFNDPSRTAVWTPVYQDESGKGLMVTLSSPIYNGDTFMGVVSLDLTTKKLGELMGGAFQGYLVDDSFSVVAANRNIKSENGVLNLGNVMHLDSSDNGRLKDMGNDSMQRVGSYYIYKSEKMDAPWTMFVAEPVYMLMTDALIRTIPIIIIGVLLFLAGREVAYRKRAEEKIKDAATTDPLTGLRNRRFLDSIIGAAMEHADRYGEPLSEVIIDLDYFKKVNDTWGHPVGDDVLIQTARLIKGIIRKADIVIRLGGEEFLILLPQTNLDGAVETAEKIRRMMEQTSHPVAGVCTASFGAAQRTRGETYISFYKRGDDALYSAKEQGRNRVCRYGDTETIPLASVQLKWNRTWESGEKNIDDQHRRLVELANSLIHMSFSKDSFERTEQQLDILLQHIVDHFAYEEKVQKAVGYPDFEEHAGIHKSLVEKTVNLKKSYQDGTLKSSEFIAFMLDDVIVGHMTNEDVKFYKYTRISDENPEKW